MKKTILFILGAVLASGLQVAAYFLDTQIADGAGWISVIIKVLFIISCVLFLSRSKVSVLSVKAGAKDLRLCLAFVMVVIVLQLVAQYRPCNFVPNLAVFLAGVLGVLTIAMWEELYYRAVAVQILEERLNRLSTRGIVVMTLVFSLSHMVNLVSGDYIAVLITVIFASGFGFLLLAIYATSKSLILPIVLHFTVNYLSTLFNTFSTNAPAVGGVWQIAVYGMMTVVMYVFGGIFFRRLFGKMKCWRATGLGV